MRGIKGQRDREVTNVSSAENAEFIIVSEMDAEKWRRIEEVFHQIEEAPPETRDALMNQLCGTDQELRSEVETLLAEDTSEEGFIRSAISDVAQSYAGQQKHELIGKQVGPYQILQKIYTGGMGAVYKAQDQATQNMVAIKVLPQMLAKHPDHIRRFQREVRSMSSLHHPNIVSILDAGEIDGCPYMVMEYVEGITLKEKVSEESLSVLEVVLIAIQVTSALSEAHRSGIIHRDITSKNIMIANDGSAKVLDFGVAKAMTNSGLNSGTLTKRGIVVGTVQFMSPEQATGKPVDHRTDLFSLGVVLYEMATCKLPFPGKTVVDTIECILKSDPSPGLNDVPSDLRQIIMKCLNKERDQRYSSARALSSDLLKLAKRLDIPAGKRDNLLTGRLIGWLARNFRSIKS